MDVDGYKYSLYAQVLNMSRDPVLLLAILNTSVVPRSPLLPHSLFGHYVSCADKLVVMYCVWRTLWKRDCKERQRTRDVKVLGKEVW